MLSFLDEGRHQKQRKSIIKFEPQMVYGHTQESSPHMLNAHTVYYQSLSEKLPQLQRPSLRQDQLQVINTQHSNEHRQPQRSSIALIPQFNLTRGEFTSFLDRHKHYKSIGELHKEMRSKQDRASGTIGIWNKSTNTLSKPNENQSRQSKMSLKFEMKRSSVGSSLPSSSLLFKRSSSSSFLGTSIDKAKIRGRRSDFADQALRELDLRKKTQCGFFGLPKDGPSHELYFIAKKKGGLALEISEGDQMNKDIQTFQKKIRFRNR